MDKKKNAFHLISEVLKTNISLICILISVTLFS